MDGEAVKQVLVEAGKAVEELPDHLQVKAFELAVGMLLGEGQPAREPSRAAPAARVATPSTLRDDHEGPDAADLLRACKRNPDRYLVFMSKLEHKGEVATTASLLECFRTYRQDMPKLPARDLGDLVAKGLIEQLGKGRDAAFVLKRKGRERLAELATAAGE
jgi:hypothetical protein